MPKMHQNTFGGPAPPKHTGGPNALPQTLATMEHLLLLPHLRNDLLCVEWDVKPYTCTHSLVRGEGNEGEGMGIEREGRGKVCGGGGEEGRPYHLHF